MYEINKACEERLAELAEEKNTPFDFADLMAAVDEVTQQIEQDETLTGIKKLELIEGALCDVLAWLGCWEVTMARTVLAVGEGIGVFRKGCKYDD